MEGPQFSQYIIPIHETLKEMGGVGNSNEVIDDVVQKLNISDEELSETISSGQSRVKNQIQWARFYLFKAGIIENSKRGTWKLSKEGLQKKLNEETVINLVKKIQKETNSEYKQKSEKKKSIIEDSSPEISDHSKKIIDLLKNLSPSGFERICKRLLTEIGIHDIEITGGPGDKGIDGIGLVKINDVVSLNFVFQCKRYKDIVSPHHVRDFRGSMIGRGEKGLILTTGRFSKEAKYEASREGITPIELIDGDRLVELFENYEIGLKPVVVYEVDNEFFEGFQ